MDVYEPTTPVPFERYTFVPDPAPEAQEAVPQCATIRSLFVVSWYAIIGSPSIPIVIEVYEPTALAVSTR